MSVVYLCYVVTTACRRISYDASWTNIQIGNVPMFNDSAWQYIYEALNKPYQEYQGTTWSSSGLYKSVCIQEIIPMHTRYGISKYYIHTQYDIISITKHCIYTCIKIGMNWIRDHFVAKICGYSPIFFPNIS